MSRTEELTLKLNRRDCDFELKRNQNSKAEDVWDKFRLVLENGVEVFGHAACTQCLTVVLFKHPTLKTKYGTKTMRDHLSRCKKKNMANGQQTVLTQHIQYVLPSTVRKQLKLLEAKYVCGGNHAIRSVEQTEFISIMQFMVDHAAKTSRPFSVKEALYGRMTVATEINNLAISYKDQMKDRISESADFGALCLTTDLYTDSLKKRAYMDVHAFWISSSMEWEHGVLAVRHFGIERHTSENIANLLTAIFEEYGINGKELAFTTDKGSNIVKALDDLNIARVNCANHRLHTAFSNGWDDSLGVTKKIKHAPEITASKDLKLYEESVTKLCAHVKRSTGIQEQLPKTLKHGGDTRPWTAVYRRADAIKDSYDTLLTVLERKDAESPAAKKTDFVSLIRAVDKGLNEKIYNLTRTVSHAFERLEMSNRPTIHYVIPAYYILAETFAPDVNDTSAIECLKRNVIRRLDKKYFCDSIVAHHWIATFLDPTYRTFSFMPETTTVDRNYKRTTLQSLHDIWVPEQLRIMQYAAIAIPPDVTDVAHTAPNVASTDPFDQIRVHQVAVAPIVGTGTEEVGRYKAGVYEEVDDIKNLPKFWKINQKNFPLLSGLARKILSLPGSSATSERDFSSVGLTLTHNRAQLDPERVEAIEMVKAAIQADMI